jgi:aspartyl-tRNA(Asn)/glutamyl-tRNA(Gln) amidotransferase subunit B
LEFEPVIGFEIHAQLVTRSKIFCGSASDVGGAPNSRVCPVCLGMPGVLPVLNREVVDHGIRVALALGARVSRRMGFARKNYFYPDLPKGYQITQFAEPLATGGSLDIETADGAKSVGIRQIHIEEDAGKTVHANRGGAAASLVDMNRCGVPLVEIVTRPDIRSIAEADALLVKVGRLLVFLGVTTGHMHEGSIRFDTNVSVRPRGTETLGTATEIKNMNSFRAVRKALEYEIGRQSAVLEGGGEVVHETLLWDETSERALPMRSKEEASDYRYFPEPDLVDVVIDDAWVERVRSTMRELPDAMRDRLIAWYGISKYDAGVLTSKLETALYYEATVHELLRLLHPETGAAAPGTGSATRTDRTFDVREHPPPRDVPEAGRAAKTVANWVMGAVAAWLNAAGDLTLTEFSDSRLPPARLAEVIVPRMIGDLSEPMAKVLLEAAIDSDEPIGRLVERLGLGQVSDEELLTEVVRSVLELHAVEADRFRAGETRLLAHFMGQVMKTTRGRANPELATAILRKLLGS